MFLSAIDRDRCLAKGSYIDETIEIELKGRTPEFIMTLANVDGVNWRLCQAKKTENGKCLFTKRTYLSDAKIDRNKLDSYFNETIQPLIERSNNLLKKQFPDVVFYE